MQLALSLARISSPPPSWCHWRHDVIGFCTFALLVSAATVDATAQDQTKYVVDGLALGESVVPISRAYREYRCGPSNQFASFVWCKRHKTEKGKFGDFASFNSILHSQKGTTAYVSRMIEPAFFGAGDVEREMERLSRFFGSRPRVLRWPQRSGEPEVVIASWGGVTLEPLDVQSLSEIGADQSVKKGMLFDFLGNFGRSAREGVPIFQLGGSAGYVWGARFDKNGRGSLRMTAIDASQFTAPPPPAPVIPEPPAGQDRRSGSSGNTAERLAECANAEKLMRSEPHGRRETDAEQEARRKALLEWYKCTAEQQREHDASIVDQNHRMILQRISQFVLQLQQQLQKLAPDVRQQPRVEACAAMLNKPIEQLGEQLARSEYYKAAGPNGMNGLKWNELSQAVKDSWLEHESELGQCEDIVNQAQQAQQQAERQAQDSRVHQLFNALLARTTAEGYKPVTLESFLLDARQLASSGEKIALHGNYWKFEEGNERLSSQIVSPDDDSIMLVTEDAPRAFRAFLLRTWDAIPNAGPEGFFQKARSISGLVLLGHAGECTQQLYNGAERKRICLFVENGWAAGFNDTSTYVPFEWRD